MVAAGACDFIDGSSTNKEMIIKNIDRNERATN